MILRFFISSILLLLFSCSSEPEETVKGPRNEEEAKLLNASMRKKSSEAKAEYERLKKENTHHNKGVIYGTRPPIQVDQEKFKKVYQEAVKGDMEYQYSLAMCYKYGYGVKEDKEKALFWFKKAADQGHKQAERVYKFMVNR